MSTALTPRGRQAQVQIRRTGRLARLLGCAVAIACFTPLLPALVKSVAAGNLSILVDASSLGPAGGRGNVLALGWDAVAGPLCFALAALASAVTGLSAAALYCRLRLPQLQRLLGAMGPAERAAVLAATQADRSGDGRHIMALLQRAPQPHLELAPATTCGWRGDEVGATGDPP